MRAFILLVGLVAATLAGAAEPPAATPVAFQGVTVIPMDRERVLRDQTVIVRDGKIAQIGPSSSVTIPADVRSVDARGKFMVPGLAEMHGHLAGDNTSLNERILALNVLHGVTTVRVMQGHPTHLELRAKAERGALLGPRLYIAAPQLNGSSAPNAEAGIAAVRHAKQQGFDLLKIQEGLSRPAFDAIALTADQVGIPFAGHVPADVGLQRALEAKFRSIDHVDGYLEALVPPDSGVDLANAGLFGSAVVGRIDANRIPELVSATKKAGTAIVPTETVARNFLDPRPVDELFSRPELRYLPASVIDGWKRQKGGIMGQLGAMSTEQRERYYSTRRNLIKALHAGGVPVLLGSDAPQVLNVPGVAVHDEIELMVAAGLTPYQALASGTREVAAHFGTLAEAGTVEQGKRADLLILDANPLDDIGNTKKQFGVVVHGRWVPRDDIERRLQAMTNP